MIAGLDWIRALSLYRGGSIYFSPRAHRAKTIAKPLPGLDEVLDNPARYEPSMTA